MNVLDPNWLTIEPHDFELKYYKLLAAEKTFNKILKDGALISILDEVEDHLLEMYKIKHRKEEIDVNLRVLKGINLDTMSLEYEYPEGDKHIEDMYKLCDKAIDILEDIHKNVRVVFRLVERSINITEIPDIKRTKKLGYALVKTPEDIMKIYSFKVPSLLTENWKDLNLKYEGETVYDIRAISLFISKVEDESSDYRFFRCSVNAEFDMDERVLPVLKFKLYNHLRAN
jgi:hypothetical protein|tara:strand:+ start:2911 stop:3597 length:687 start_codon:yes stop_codon:yes gene_type:complete